MPRYKKGPNERFPWGRFIVDGRAHSEDDRGVVGSGKDISLIGRHVTEGQEREGHRLKPGMVGRIYHHDLETLVIGIGVESQV
jgi:hypothetical protein